SDFRSGLGSFASPQNGFLSGAVTMEQQGPWMANFIENLAPKMNRWHVPPEKLQREKDFAKLHQGMSLNEVVALLGQPVSSKDDAVTFDAGIKPITLAFSKDRNLTSLHMDYIPALERRKYCQWGAAPFPNAFGRKEIVSFCGFDILVIPRGSKHKKEAFEF